MMQGPVYGINLGAIRDENALLRLYQTISLTVLPMEALPLRQSIKTT